MSDSNREEDNQGNGEHRPVKNLKGLLKFCLEATKSEDAPDQGLEGVRPMTDERRKWLEEALTSMTVSPVERMNACLSLIEGAAVDTEQGTEQQVRAVTELQDWSEDLDIAADFIKINGLRIVPRLLSSEVSELRWRCLELLANLSQNNPVGQHAVLGLDLLPAIILLLETDPNPAVRIKALYAVSCLVRSNVKAQRQLVSCDGLKAVLEALQSDEEKLRYKATFLISSLCSSDPCFKDWFVERGAIDGLIDFLKTEAHSGLHEHFMSALLALVSDCRAAQEKCLRPELDLQSFLCQRTRLLEGKEEFQEEKDYAEKILNVLNQVATSSPTSSSTQSQQSMSLMIA